jgi:tripartite-type tricarboxylate transporter receptor subunit TctC
MSARIEPVHIALYIAFVLGLCSGVMSLRAGAADFPTRPIRVVVPFPAGGSTDVMARTIGQALGRSFGKPLIIDNRPGAAGNLGAELVVKATPDGHTLLYGPGFIVTTNPWLYQNQSFDPLKQLAPVAHVGSGGFALAAHLKAPFTTLTGLIEYARRNPGRVNYGSYGNGSFPHLAMEMLKGLAGFDATHVPYRGGAPAMADLIAGQIGVMFDSNINVLPQVRAGRIRALAVAMPVRNPQLPDVPTVAEQFPDFRATSWHGVFAPVGTPPAILDRLHDAIARALHETDVETRMHELSFEPSRLDRRQFSAEIVADSQRWRDIVNKVGVTAD